MIVEFLWWNQTNYIDSPALKMTSVKTSNATYWAVHGSDQRKDDIDGIVESV